MKYLKHLLFVLICSCSHILKSKADLYTDSRKAKFPKGDYWWNAGYMSSEGLPDCPLAFPGTTRCVNTMISFPKTGTKLASRMIFDSIAAMMACPDASRLADCPRAFCPKSKNIFRLEELESCQRYRAIARLDRHVKEDMRLERGPSFFEKRISQPDPWCLTERGILTKKAATKQKLSPTSDKCFSVPFESDETITYMGLPTFSHLFHGLPQKKLYKFRGRTANNTVRLGFSAIFHHGSPETCYEYGDISLLTKTLEEEYFWEMFSPAKKLTWNAIITERPPHSTAHSASGYFHNRKLIKPEQTEWFLNLTKSWFRAIRNIIANESIPFRAGWFRFDEDMFDVANCTKTLRKNFDDIYGMTAIPDASIELTCASHRPYSSGSLIMNFFEFFKRTKIQNF